jgi:hypothetical protein
MAMHGEWHPAFRIGGEVVPQQTEVVHKSWSEVAQSIEFVPDEYSDRTHAESVAQEMLACSPEDIDTLIEAGLPCERRPGGRFFDANDLYNLGMYSGRSRTQPELAFRMLFRFAGRPVDGLLRPKSWKFRVALDCPDCTEVAPWRFEGPDVARFGGEIADVSAPVPSRASGEYAATVTVTGERTPLLSKELRQAVDDYLRAGYRWQMVPVPMQFDYERVHELGVTSCIAASLFLAERFRAAGYQADVRRGWFCGVLGGALDLPHACVEVTDDDGRVKTVDIAKAQLAARLADNTGEFQELCLGSIYNKVILSTASGDVPLSQHGCGSQSPVKVRADVQSVR